MTFLLAATFLFAAISCPPIHQSQPRFLRYARDLQEVRGRRGRFVGVK
jgi:hypothetical protein